MKVTRSFTHSWPLTGGLGFLCLLLSLFISGASIHASDDIDHYRRSSLCLILLAHSEKEYADAMVNVFKDFPLPQRYNEHNISDVRVIRVSGKQDRKSIEKLIEKHDIGRKVISRWFNQNPTAGYMDMSLIHDRGGYGASHEDYELSKNNVRGTAMLRDEGLELIQNTFILVCDMDYIDQKVAAQRAAKVMSFLAAGMQIAGAYQVQSARLEMSKGNYKSADTKMRQAQAWNLGSAVTNVGATVVNDIGGFRVHMKSYLYKLEWDNETTQAFFRNYWCDSSMSDSDIESRKQLFANDKKIVRLTYIGDYKAKSSKTILRSWSNESEVILDVCKRCVDKGLTQLAKKFVVFRPRAPFYFDGKDMYSHIGRKEEVAYGRKYEIIQPYKDKKGNIRYKKVSEATAAKPWNNLEIRFDQYFDENDKGTNFVYKHKKEKLSVPGLQLREL